MGRGIVAAPCRCFLNAKKRQYYFPALTDALDGSVTRAANTKAGNGGNEETRRQSQRTSHYTILDVTFPQSHHVFVANGGKY